MNILIADDHELVRQGLSLIVKRLSKGAQVLFASNYSQLEHCLENIPDWGLIIMDLVMPGTDSMRGIRLVRRIAPDTPTLVISANEENQVIRDVLALGVRGYLPKTASSDVMVNAISLVLAGGRYLPDSLLDAAPLREDRLNDSGPRTLPGLTPRQSEVAILLSEGKSNKEIGRSLGMSEATVRTHLTVVFRKLEVSSRTQALIAINRLL